MKNGRLHVLKSSVSPATEPNCRMQLEVFEQLLLSATKTRNRDWSILLMLWTIKWFLVPLVTKIIYKVTSTGSQHFRDLFADCLPSSCPGPSFQCEHSLFLRLELHAASDSLRSK